MSTPSASTEPRGGTEALVSSDNDRNAPSERELTALHRAIAKAPVNENARIEDVEQLPDMDLNALVASQQQRIDALLQQTQRIPRLIARQQIDANIDDIHSLLRQALSVLDHLKKQAHILKNHEADVSRYKNFTIVTEKQEYVRKAIPHDKYVTNCKSCNRTCHEKCWVHDKRGCAVMNSETKMCTVCKVCQPSTRLAACRHCSLPSPTACTSARGTY